MREHVRQIPIKRSAGNRGFNGAICLVLAGMTILLTDCSTNPDAQSRVHSMWLLTSSAQTRPLNTAVHPAYHGPIFLTESDPPNGPSAEQIAIIDAGTVSDQPTETVLITLANEARKAGANAVFRVKIWRQGSGFTWNAPHGSGTAVNLVDTNVISGLNGYWY